MLKWENYAVCIQSWIWCITVEENTVLEYGRVVDYSENLGFIADESSCLGEASSWCNVSPQEEMTYTLGK